MATFPFILNLADELDRLSMAAVSPYYHPEPPYFYRQSPQLGLLPKELDVHRRSSQPGPVSTIGKDGFQVSMNVGHFKPSELSVKVVDDSVVVEGKHEEREDHHGYISRHFVRRYALPKGYDACKVLSTLSSDGVLTVQVPKPAVAEKSIERIVQIQQVGPAHLNVKENPKLEDLGEDSAAG